MAGRYDDVVAHARDAGFVHTDDPIVWPGQTGRKNAAESDASGAGDHPEVEVPERGVPRPAEPLAHAAAKDRAASRQALHPPAGITVPVRRGEQDDPSETCG